MDINVLVVLLTFGLILVVLMFMGRKPGWGLVGFFGALITCITTLALLNDGNLTQISGGVSNTLAAANGNFVSDFNAISTMPILLSAGELVVTMRRIFHI